ncbi:FecCD family ABC transporter permease [Microbulbifer agarilyticus]|uniref:FecCD family ABC transporter permease n=1 Tax=Microbulbifer agarilyticus TaxID=260552 RepID=UPI001C966C7D|nr:iron ABC transporter permease [Microbulbifer agarilyticus]MBY6210270.1 iron ABC transporter permease [Microbulbifer agarilyticus]MCA0892761.1 iron ABC transporter permease [Microbulbifer agarilyticus]
MEFRLSDKSLLPVLIALLLLGSGLSLAVGAMHITWQDVVAGLLHWSWPGALDLDVPDQYALVLGEIRLPRLLLGLIVGGTLGMCGAVLQGMFRNPLAEPGIIGVSSGAAVGAGTVLVFGSVLAGTLGALDTFGSWAGALFEQVQWFLLPAFASAGAILATWLVYVLGDRGRSVVMMLLAGIAVSALAGAVLGMFAYVATDTALRDMTMWQLGSLAGASWTSVLVTGCIFIASSVLLWLRAGDLNALLLGESEARHLGVDVHGLKRQIIVLNGIAVGAVVSVSGIIGFVGLVVPHIVRLLRGPDHRFLIPYSALLGGLLLTVADTIARSVFAPAELPVGILTAIIGAPFFLFLLWQQRRQIV